MFGFFNKNEEQIPELDRHTRSYLFDQFGYSGETISASLIIDLMDEADVSEFSQDFGYLMRALDTVEDGVYKDAAKLKLLHKIGRF